MSKVGKKPIIVPSGVEVKTEQQPEGVVVSVRGPKGVLSHLVDKDFIVSFENNQIIIAPKSKVISVRQKALWGLYRALLQNIVVGVTGGFEKRLDIEGIGYKAVVQGSKLVLNIGLSHPVEMEMPKGVDVKVEKNTIIISGIDKYLVGQVAADVRSHKPPEPYKGKGIRYKNEVVVRKAGKKAAGATG